MATNNSSRPGEQNGRAKLTAEQVREILRDPRGYRSTARVYGTPITSVVQSPWIGPGCGSLVEFHGDLTAAGYLSHFFSADDVPETAFGEWLRAIAQAARNETLAAFTAAKTPRRTRARKQSRKQR